MRDKSGKLNVEHSKFDVDAHSNKWQVVDTQSLANQDSENLQQVANLYRGLLGKKPGVPSIFRKLSNKTAPLQDKDLEVCQQFVHNLNYPAGHPVAILINRVSRHDRYSESAFLRIVDAVLKVNNLDSVSELLSSFDAVKQVGDPAPNAPPLDGDDRLNNQYEEGLSPELPGNMDPDIEKLLNSSLTLDLLKDIEDDVEVSEIHDDELEGDFNHDIMNDTPLDIEGKPNQEGYLDTENNSPLNLDPPPLQVDLAPRAPELEKRNFHVPEAPPPPAPYDGASLPQSRHQPLANINKNSRELEKEGDSIQTQAKKNHTVYDVVHQAVQNEKGHYRSTEANGRTEFTARDSTTNTEICRYHHADDKMVFVINDPQKSSCIIQQSYPDTKVNVSGGTDDQRVEMIKTLFSDNMQVSEQSFQGLDDNTVKKIKEHEQACIAERGNNLPSA